MKRYHAAFLQRQQYYERKFARVALALLAKHYHNAADIYPQAYNPDPETFEDLLDDIYHTIMPDEARRAWELQVAPLLEKSQVKKDFIDSMLRAYSRLKTSKVGEWINVWREATARFVSVYTVTKIKSMADTTRRTIAKIIEREINEGTSIEKIRDAIREEADGMINRHRATAIARTETVAALNRGKRLAMYSNGLLWEKKWLDTPDDRTRATHRDIAAQDWRHIDDPYWLDSPSGLEPAYYPGDPELSPQNVINCRCTEIYRVVRDPETNEPIRREDLDDYNMDVIVASIM